MDKRRLDEEVARTDPDVPFRATDKHVHRTWARTFQSRPELYIRPQTLDEVRKVVNLARKCRRRIVVVGCGHSPSDLTCTSSWMVNLDNYSKVLKVDKQKKTILVEGGIRLQRMNREANKHGLTMKNIGSINEQSIVGAISTGTHGSSLKHGLLSQSVRSLRIVLANGQAVRCSKDQNPELFKAALLSLGALGIIVEVEFEMIESGNIEWEQTMVPLAHVLDNWNKDLWTQKEYTRIWWLPYTKRTVIWSASKTNKPISPPNASWYGGSVGYYTYHNLLAVASYIPWIVPWIEWFIFGMQFGFTNGQTTSAVEDLETGLLLNCLYSQFVNEWALPLHKGPEAISRLSDWMNQEQGGGGIPFSAKGIYVHSPIEVRVSDTSSANPKPYLDNTVPDAPTLYLNAIFYRAYLKDPPGWQRFYEAFEWLMREMGGKPHYAKNLTHTTSDYLQQKLGDGLTEWLKIRNEADPDGMFLGEWHKRTLGLGDKRFALLEHEKARQKASDGGQMWIGEVVSGATSVPETFVAPPIALTARSDSPGASSSASSFDFMHGAEAERSTLFSGNEVDDEDEDELTDRDDARYHGNPRTKLTGTAVFDKM